MMQLVRHEINFTIFSHNLGNTEDRAVDEHAEGVGVVLVQDQGRILWCS